MLYKLLKKISFAIFLILINQSIFSSDPGNKITLEMLTLLLVPSDTLKEQIIKKYETLLKQILPNGLTSLELGSKSKIEADYFDNYYSPRTFSEDGKTYIRDYCWEGVSKIDTNTNKVIQEINLKELLNKKHIDKIANAKDKYIAVAAVDIIILIDENKEMKILKDIQAKSHRISQLSFSPDCKRLAYGNYDDNNIVIWDISNIKDIKYQNLKNEHYKSVTCSFSKDNKFFLSNCGDTICLWDAKDLLVISKIEIGNYSENGKYDYVKLSNDNKYIIAGSHRPYDQGGLAKIWDIENPSNPVNVAQTPYLGSGFINVGISDDSKYFITTNWNQIILWKINDLISGSKNPISILAESNRENTKAIYNLDFNRSDKYLISSGHGVPKIFDFSKAWIVDDLNLQQIIFIIILASSNDVAKELELNSHYSQIGENLDPKVSNYLFYYLRLKATLKLNDIVALINSYSSYDFQYTNFAC